MGPLMVMSPTSLAHRLVADPAIRATTKSRSRHLIVRCYAPLAPLAPAQLLIQLCDPGGRLFDFFHQRSRRKRSRVFSPAQYPGHDFHKARNFEAQLDFSFAQLLDSLRVMPSSFADQLRSRAPEPDAHPHGFVSGEYAESSFQKLIDGKVFRPLESLVKRSEERRVGKECRSRWSPYH